MIVQYVMNLTRWSANTWRCYQDDHPIFQNIGEMIAEYFKIFGWWYPNISKYLVDNIPIFQNARWALINTSMNEVSSTPDHFRWSLGEPCVAMRWVNATSMSSARGTRASARPICMSKMVSPVWTCKAVRGSALMGTAPPRASSARTSGGTGPSLGRRSASNITIWREQLRGTVGKTSTSTVRTASLRNVNGGNFVPTFCLASFPHILFGNLVLTSSPYILSSYLVLTFYADILSWHLILTSGPEIMPYHLALIYCLDTLSWNLVLKSLPDIIAILKPCTENLSSCLVLTTVQQLTSHPDILFWHFVMTSGPDSDI